MSKIELRGIIVPSDYDDEYMWPYIQRGVITPESYFRKMLKQASVSEPLNLYINSQGGSVFAGNEMINAVRDWKLATGQRVEITVGAMAASMAAAMVVFAGDAVKLHRNSKIMFHGASTVTIGGEGAHKDAAELVGKINAEVKSALISRYKLQPERVDQWFAEGRAGWLGADEAMACGMAAGIVEDDAAPVEAAATFARQMERGMALAACLENICGNEKPKEKEMIAKIKSLFGLGESMAEPEVEKFVETLKKPEAVDAAYDEGKAAGLELGKTEKASELAAKIQEAETRLAEFSAQIAEKAAEVETLKSANAELAVKMERLTAGLKAPEGDAPTGAAGFFAAVGKAVEDGSDRDEAMIKVQRENPRLFAEMIAEANKK